MLQRIRAHKVNLAGRKSSIASWQVAPEVRAEVLRFLDDLSIGKVNRGKRVGENAQLRYFDGLKVFFEFFGKPTESLQIQDVETFEKALEANQIKSSLKGTDYAYRTKSSIRKSLKVFLRWRFGQVKALELAGWIDTRDRRTTPDFLWETEVEALMNACHSAEQRYVVAMLFDSGARAEEFINIRYEDLQLPQGDEYVKVALREEFSKTIERTISLYWRHTLPAVKEYLQERIRQGIKPTDPVYAGTYGSMRMFLRRLGKRALKKPVKPHLFRHSSATHYATKMNRQELCYRYGWMFSSDSPDIYISRAGMQNKQLDEKFANTALGEMKDRLIRREEADKIKDDRLRRAETAIEYLLEQLTGKKVTHDDALAAIRKKELRVLNP